MSLQAVPPLKGLVYWGSEFDMKPLSNPLFKSFNHFIFIDALPKLQHYKPHQVGYKYSKDREAFVKTIIRRATKKKYKLIRGRDEGNHLVFKNPDGKTLDYFINTTVEESLNDPVIKDMFKTVRWIHNEGFNPFSFGLTIELVNTLMPNTYRNLAALMADNN